MALDNLISIELSDADMAIVNGAIDTIEGVFASKLVNLTPEQRQSHGRVKYEMEFWVQKSDNYMVANPPLVPTFIDMAEHSKDIAAHSKMNPLIDRMEKLLRAMLDTNLLLGTDLYNNCLTFYRSLKAAARANAPGASAIYADLKQQFPGGGGGGKTPPKNIP